VLSRATLANIRQNLLFAFLYDALVLLAAAGPQSPVAASRIDIDGTWADW
jgi:cation transport ATPase